MEWPASHRHENSVGQATIVKQSSRDTNGLLLDVGTNLLAQPFFGNQIHRAAQKRFEEKLQVHIAVKGCRAIAINQDIHIATITQLVARRSDS